MPAHGRAHRAKYRGHLLATSRESLRSEGERIFRLFPLDYPPQRDDLGVEEVLSYPAVQLFVERITESLGEFQLSPEEAPLVANICRRLDGIALAIELAAGRVNATALLAASCSQPFSLQWRGRRTAVQTSDTRRGARLEL
jgi:predicted ATPase